MAKAWLELYAQFTDSSEKDAEPRKVIGLYEGIRQARFRNGLACVHCGSLRVKEMEHTADVTLFMQGLRKKLQ